MTEVRDSHVKLEERKCGDYFVWQKWPKRSATTGREWDKERLESLSRAWGAVCQKALPCPHWTPVSEPVSIYICTKRTVPLTKAFLSHGDSLVPPRQPFTPPKGLWERALSEDCSEQKFKLWRQSLKLRFSQGFVL